MPTGNRGGVGFSRFRILPLLLLNREAELGSSGHGPRFLGKVLEEKHETCDGSSTFWGGEVGT